MYPFTDGGLQNIWLANGYEIRHTPHGEGVVIQHLDALVESICTALAKSNASLSGVEFRYLRSAGLKQSQVGLAKLLGNDEQSIARWEKSGRPPAWADKLIRILYLGFADGEATIASAVHAINAIERAKRGKFIFCEIGAQWRSQRQDETAC